MVYEYCGLEYLILNDSGSTPPYNDRSTRVRLVASVRVSSDMDGPWNIHLYPSYYSLLDKGILILNPYELAVQKKNNCGSKALSSPS